MIMQEFDTRRQSNSFKVVDDFLNPKFYQVPKEISQKYKLKFHERFNLFKDKEYENIYFSNNQLTKKNFREGDIF